MEIFPIKQQNSFQKKMNAVIKLKILWENMVLYQFYFKVKKGIYGVHDI